MRIALAQTDIVWEDIEANERIAEEMFQEASKEAVEIIVFPEMSLTGFTMDVKKFHDRDKDQITFFKDMSKKYGVAAVFGYLSPVSEEEWDHGKRGKNYRNMLAIARDGEILLSYAKIHPFTYGLEGKDFRGGEGIYGLKWENTSLGAFICYDLRFPEIFQISSKKSEVIFVIAEWPASRISQWDILLSARAVENQCYIVAVNRTGEGGGLVYNGHSAVYAPSGERITPLKEEAGLIISDLDLDEVKTIRKRMVVKLDRRPELYREAKLEMV